MVDPPRVRELERTRFLAARYPDLRGLRLVPWGVVIILLSLTIDSPVTGPAWWAVLGLFLASIPAAALLAWLANRHYRRRYGQARRKLDGLGVEILGWLVAFGVLAVVMAILFRVAGDAPVSLFGLQTAAILAFTAWRMGRFAWHRLALAGLLALVSLLPLGLLTEEARHPLDGNSNVLLLTVVGLYVVVIGLMDHWLLVRAFRRRAGAR